MDSRSSSAASLNDLFRLNCRERLYVEPLHWTDRHLELLQCSFDDQPLAPWTTVHPPTSYDAEQKAIRHVQYLISSRRFTHRKDAMQSILAPPGGLLIAAESVLHTD